MSIVMFNKTLFLRLHHQADIFIFSLFTMFLCLRSRNAFYNVYSYSQYDKSRCYWCKSSIRGGSFAYFQRHMRSPSVVNGDCCASIADCYFAWHQRFVMMRSPTCGPTSSLHLSIHAVTEHPLHKQVNVVETPRSASTEQTPVMYA